MSEKHTGGAAFPSPNNVRVGDFMSGGHEGMTLRDYFAAKALQGLLSNSGGPIQYSPMSGWHLCNCKIEDVTGMAYGFADSMLEARNV